MPEVFVVKNFPRIHKFCEAGVTTYNSLVLMRLYENEAKHYKQTMCNGVRRETDESLHFKSLFVHLGTQQCGIVANNCLQATCLQCVASFLLSHEYS